MKYSKTIILKNGVECCLRNGIESDGQAVWDCMKREDIMLLFKLVNEFQEKTSLIVTANYSLTDVLAASWAFAIGSKVTSWTAPRQAPATSVMTKRRNASFIIPFMPF